MDVKSLAKVAHGLGINVSGLTNRNQVLTRLMESATDVSLLH